MIAIYTDKIMSLADSTKNNGKGKKKNHNNNRNRKNNTI